MQSILFNKAGGILIAAALTLGLMIKRAVINSSNIDLPIYIPGDLHTSGDETRPTG